MTRRPYIGKVDKVGIPRLIYLRGVQSSVRAVLLVVGNARICAPSSVHVGGTCNGGCDEDLGKSTLGVLVVPGARIGWVWGLTAAVFG